MGDLPATNDGWQGKQKYLATTLPQCHFVHHKPHYDLSTLQFL